MSTKRTHLILSALLVGITLCLGWLSQRYSSALDLTTNGRHSLSQSSKSVLAALKDPVEIIAVVGPDTQQRSAITELVSRLQSEKSDVTLTFINPETNPAAVRELQAENGGSLILRSAGRESRLKSLSERSLSNGLRQLNRDQDHRIAFITGHEERSPSNISNFDWGAVANRLAAIGLVSEEHSLVSDPVLGDDIDLVVIAAPRRPYFPGEIASLNSYLAQGGNLLWLSELDEGSASGPNLQFLADYLGVDTLPGRVIDKDSSLALADSPGFILLTRFPNHPVNSLLNNPILLPQASALAITPLAGQTVLPLLQTTETSWIELGELSGAVSFDETSGEIAGPLLLGVSVERQTPSGTQRMAVIGDADFASSQFVDNGDNQVFAEGLMLWLTGESDSLEFITQSAPDTALTLDNRSIIVLSGLYLAGIPLLLLLIGIVVRWRNRKA
ncbi:MAG: GldG family protein [Granulosicoccus sp.]